jgi:hypothetical protein
MPLNHVQQMQQLDLNPGQTAQAQTQTQRQARSQSCDEPSYPSGRQRESQGGNQQSSPPYGYGFSGAARHPQLKLNAQDLAKGFMLVPVAEDLQWLYDRSLVTPKVMTYSKQLIERVSRLEFAMRQVIRRCDHTAFTHRLGEMPLHCAICLLHRSLQRNDIGAVVYTCQEVPIPVVADGGLTGFGRYADSILLPAGEGE